MNVFLWLLTSLTVVAKTSSTTPVEKVSKTFDKTSPADFYGLFIDNSKLANKDEEGKVSLHSTGVVAVC